MNSDVMARTISDAQSRILLVLNGRNTEHASKHYHCNGAQRSSQTIFSTSDIFQHPALTLPSNHHAPLYAMSHPVLPVPSLSFYCSCSTAPVASFPVASFPVASFPAPAHVTFAFSSILFYFYFIFIFFFFFFFFCSRH
ncbi:hypothetical protein CLIB1423_22S01970 [[Candida] railenensis]|uniref:Uncharacterized protein n=1 Tax=[Candida] railenensis TaxID=45579 RepID=A0A9P0QT86_9ASCO|nr:hypothetical protein CLIB1423_22S01970 [[Candida] railenensis]